MILEYVGGAGVTGLVTLAVLLLNRHWQKKDKKDDAPVEKNASDIEELRRKHKEDMDAINGELTVICYGVLAALKGLAEQGCDGPVHDAINSLEKHLNQKAHQ